MTTSSISRRTVPGAVRPAPAPGHRPRSQRETPLLTGVREAAHLPARLHTPGHEGGAWSAPDVENVVGRAFLEHDIWIPTGELSRALTAAEDLAAEAWGAKRAWLIGNGSTAGTLAWLLATSSEGQEVVVGRDAHTSVMAGLILSGARPVWVPPRICPDHEISLGVEVSDVDRVLARTPSACQVVATSPGYASICVETDLVCEVARRSGVLAYVDQAWGPHLAFHPDLPTDALAAGADGAVVSLHKTGTALSSGALLLAGNGLSRERIARLDTAVRMTQTTSPLLPLLASVDAARRDLVVRGKESLEVAVREADALAGRLRRIGGLRVLEAEDVGLPFHRKDPLKIVVDVSGLGLTGWQVGEELRHLGVAVEGADDRRIYLVRGACVDGTGGAARLRHSEDDAVRAFSALAARLRPVTGSFPVSVPGDARQTLRTPGAWQVLAECPDQVLTPRQAFQAQTVAVPLAQAIGRVVAEPVVPYPPGVPVLLPGEVVGGVQAEFLREVLAGGGHLHGCADPGLTTLRVVAGV
ncbi:MAG: hypothetical protein QG622_1340 [Actinomycetota bacterium]|nr:hypothetical protein [Actinomycetota bacterium]